MNMLLACCAESALQSPPEELTRVPGGGGWCLVVEEVTQQRIIGVLQRIDDPWGSLHHRVFVLRVHSLATARPDPFALNPFEL